MVVEDFKGSYSGFILKKVSLCRLTATINDVVVVSSNPAHTSRPKSFIPHLDIPFSGIQISNNPHSGISSEIQRKTTKRLKEKTPYRIKNKNVLFYVY